MPGGRPGYSYAQAPTSTSSRPSPLTSAQPTPVPAKLPSLRPSSRIERPSPARSSPPKRGPAEGHVGGALPRVRGRDAAPLRGAGDHVVVAVAVDVARPLASAPPRPSPPSPWSRASGHVSQSNAVSAPSRARGPRAARRRTVGVGVDRQRQRGGSRPRPARTRPPPGTTRPRRASRPSRRRRTIANEPASPPASSTAPTTSGPAPLLVSVNDLRGRRDADGLASAKRRVTGESDVAGCSAAPVSVTGTGP